MNNIKDIMKKNDKQLCTRQVVYLLFQVKK